VRKVTSVTLADARSQADGAAPQVVAQVEARLLDDDPLHAARRGPLPPELPASSAALQFGGGLLHRSSVDRSGRAGAG
jgi:hypothetical protein